MEAYIVKNFANVASFVLYCSMGSILFPIWEAGNTLEFFVYPYLVLFLSSGFWSLYGVPEVKGQSGGYSISVSIIGVGMSIVYLAIFARFSTPRKQIIILVAAGLEAVLIGIVAAISLLAVKSVIARTRIVGMFAIICGELMYAAPLLTMTQVAETRDLSRMRLKVCLVGVVNGTLWVIYGLLLDPIDQFIVSANGIGAGFSVLQIAFYAYQYCTTRNDVEGDGEVRAIPV